MKPDKVTSLVEYLNADLIKLFEHGLAKSKTEEIKGAALVLDLGDWGHHTIIAGSYNADPEGAYLELMLALNKAKNKRES